MNDRVAELCCRLQPIQPQQVIQLWAAYQADPDPASRGQIEHLLEVLAQKHLGLGFQPDRSPFVPPPPEWAQGGELPVGEVVYAGKRHCDFNFEIDRLTEHVLVCGRSGSGKSTLTLHLARGLMQRGVIVTAFDWKRSYRDLLRDTPPGTLRIRTPGRSLAPFFWNPLIPPPGTDPVLYAKLIVDVISRALLGGDGVISLLHRGILALYKREGVGTDQQQRWPTIHDLLEWLEGTKLTGRAALWKSSADRILRAMTYGEFGKMIDTQSSADLHELLDIHHVLELDGLAGSADRIIFAEGVTLWLSRYLLQRGESSSLRHSIIHEESHHLFKASESGSAQESVLEQSLRMARAYGVGYIIVDQTASMLSKTVFSNTGTVFALSQKLRSDVQAMAGAMNLNDAQRQAISTLPIGTAIARVPDGHPEPFLVRIPPPSPPPEERPHVTDEQVRHAASAHESATQSSGHVTIEDEIVQQYLALRNQQTTSLQAASTHQADAPIPSSDSGDSAPIHARQTTSEAITPLPPPEKNTCETVDPMPTSDPKDTSSYRDLGSKPTGSEATHVAQSSPPSESKATTNTHPPAQEDHDLDPTGEDGSVTSSDVSDASIASRKPTRPPATLESAASQNSSRDPPWPAALHDAAAARFLGDLAQHPLSTTVERYQRLKLSRRRGHALRNMLVGADLARPVRIPTRSGNVVLLELTTRGRRHCTSLGIEPPRTGSAGLTHRYWAQRVAQALAGEGYKVSHEYYVEGNGRVDLLAMKEDERLPCEIETGRSDTASNIQSALKHFGRLLIVATCPEAVAQCDKIIHKLPAAQQRRVTLKTWLDY